MGKLNSTTNVRIKHGRNSSFNTIWRDNRERGKKKKLNSMKRYN